MQTAPYTQETDAEHLRRSALHGVASAALSVLLHLLVAGPYIAWAWLYIDERETPGEEGPEDQPIGDGLIGEHGEAKPTNLPPVQVSLYVEPTPTPAPPTEDPRAPAEAPVEPEKKKKSTPAEAPPEEKTAAEGEAARGSPDNSGVQGSPAPGKKSNCDPVPEIVKIDAHRWRIDRDLVDYYASHLRELNKQAGTSTHKDPETGEIVGVRVYLPKCSVLRQVGLRNGDIIHSINGRSVSTVPQAVATYLALRNEQDFVIKLSRKDGTPVTHHYRLKR